MPKFVRKSKFSPRRSTKKALPVPKNNKLTPSMKIFADQWLIDRNGTQAYKIAYPNVKNDPTAGVLAFHLLKNPKISKYIAEKLEKISAKAEIDMEWILKRYKMLVDYSVDDFFDGDGNVKSLSEIPRNKLYAICGFKANKIITDNDTSRIETIIREFKFPDKKGVLDSLAKYLGMFEKDNTQKRTMPSEINVRLVE